MSTLIGVGVTVSKPIKPAGSGSVPDVEHAITLEDGATALTLEDGATALILSAPGP